MDKVSKEVSVIDGKTVLPIGSLEKVSLGDLLGSETELPEGIIKNEDGSYEFFYELETTSVSAGDFELPTSFDIAASSSSFNIDLPSLDFNTYGAGVKETFGLDLPLGSSFKQLLQNVGAGATEFEITSFMLNLIPEDQRQFAKELSEEVEIDEIKFDLPEQIKSLNRVIFDNPVEGHDGAPFGVHLDLKGFAGINAGMNQNTADIIQTINADTIANMQNTNAINAGITNLGTQLAQCCCDSRYENAKNYADLSYALATQACDTRRAIADSTRDIIDSNNAGVRSILDFLTQDKIATLTAENQSLKFAASQSAQNAYLVGQLKEPCAVPAYVVPNPNCCYGNFSTFNNCGC
jgi:hypothetical protein